MKKFPSDTKMHKRAVLLSGVILAIIAFTRNLFKPLLHDEVTYFSLAESMLYSGSYHLGEVPSSFPPVYPLWIVFLYIPSNPELTILLLKMANWIFIFGALWLYHQLFIRELKTSGKVFILIAGIFCFNAYTVSLASMLYAESMIIFLLSAVVVFSVKITYSNKAKYWFVLGILISMLSLTKMNYLLLFGVFPLLWRYQQPDFKQNPKKILKAGSLLFFSVVPVIIWWKYTVNIQETMNISASSFARFSEQSIFLLLSEGLGSLSKLVSLFIPAEDFRSWPLSIGILIFALGGWVLEGLKNRKGVVVLSIVLLVFFSIIIGGTGMSRYWLPVFPLLLYGIILFADNLSILRESTIEYLLIAILILYLLNETRLFYLYSYW